MNGLLASQGRNGDTKISHTTPGEVIVPKEVAALRPDIVAHIAGQVRKMGGNPSNLVVGRGKVNPVTGIEEHATDAEIAAAYQDILGRDAAASEISAWKDYGAGSQDLNTFKTAFTSAAAPELAMRNTGTNYIQPNPSIDNTGLLGGNITTTTGPGGIDTSIYNIGQAPVTQQATATTVDPASQVMVTAPVMEAPPPLEAYLAEWQGYDPTLISAEQQSQMMVDQQMGKYLDPDSAINKQVINAANAQSASRGMLNSSFVTENAMNAMTQIAAQLGTQDANTIYNVAVQNMGAENAAKAFAADAFNKASIANADFQNQTARFNTQIATDVLMANTANALQANIINAEQANSIAKLNAELITNTDLSNVQSANQMAAMVFETATQAGLANTDALNQASIAAAENATRIEAANISADASVQSAGISAAATISAANIRAASDAIGYKLKEDELEAMQQAGFADDYIQVATNTLNNINANAGDPIAMQAAADMGGVIIGGLVAIAGIEDDYGLHDFGSFT